MLDDDKVHCILMIVKQIPYGKVATYGQVARLAGIPRNSRQVGTVLKTLPENSGVPWFRVVNSRGEISDRQNGTSSGRQRAHLENESIVFDDRSRIPLQRFAWNPKID